MSDTRVSLLHATKEKLQNCKRVLSVLEPSFFMGVGLQFMSLAARQMLFESVNTTGENELGWFGNLEDTGWLFKHQREVDCFYEYCNCVDELLQRGAPVEVIIQDCTRYAPETQVASAFIVSEGIRKAFQWLTQ